MLQNFSLSSNLLEKGMTWQFVYLNIQLSFQVSTRLLLKAMNLKNHNILKVHDLVKCIELQITLHFISNASVLKICLKFLICIC